MSLTTLRPLARTPAPTLARAAHSRRAPIPPNPWRSRTHLKKATPTLPNPMPAIYAQKVVLSDGSTFTSCTTAPTPSILRLTRDVTNNPLWAPGTERRGAGDDSVDGRVGRFRRRFEVAAEIAEGAAAEEAPKKAESAFGAEDLSWMSVGAKEETLSDRQRAGPQKRKAKK